MYEGKSDEELLDLAEEFIENGNLGEAKKILDSVKVKSGRKYFIESKYYKNKGWFNEERKCLKKALKAEPENEEYKAALQDLETFRKSDEYREIKKQMGCKDAFAEACCECSCEACALGICESICDGCS